MITKISRYAIMSLIVISLSILLPDLYWMIFGKPIIKPSIYYSPVIEEFMIVKRIGNNKKEYSDQKENNYDRKSFETLLPFTFFYNLEKWGILPDSIKGIPMKRSYVRHNSQHLRITNRAMNTPLIYLNPLFESESDFTRLEVPGELFRIDQKLEFITASDNTVDDSLSCIYNSALLDQGFQFPAKIIAGNPTTRKPFDEGYFIVDAQNTVFHLKKIKGQPHCVKTDIPPDLNIRAIFISEHSRKEFYGVIVTWTNEIYLITYDNYKILQLPVEGYRADDMKLLFSINPLYKKIRYSDMKEMKYVVIDNNYKIVDKYATSWMPKEEWKSSKIASALFPFSIERTTGNSDYVQFKVKFNGHLSWIGILFALLATFICKRFVYREKLRTNWIDFIIVFGTGIFGAITVLLIRPEPWD